MDCMLNSKGGQKERDLAAFCSSERNNKGDACYDGLWDAIGCYRR